MTKKGVRGSSGGHKANYTLANGLTARSMEWVCGSLPMAIAIWANGSMELLKVKASINAKMVKTMKAVLRIF